MLTYLYHKNVSKEIMYRMYYEVMRPHFNFYGPDSDVNNRAHLCYCDKDSLVNIL